MDENLDKISKNNLEQINIYLKINFKKKNDNEYKTILKIYKSLIILINEQNYNFFIEEFLKVNKSININSFFLRKFWSNYLMFFHHKNRSFFRLHPT